VFGDGGGLQFGGARADPGSKRRRTSHGLEASMADGLDITDAPRGRGGEVVMRSFWKQHGAGSGERVGRFFGVLSPLAVLACGVEMPVDGGELGGDEDVATATQAVTTCYASYQFDFGGEGFGKPGLWRRMPINPPCATFDPTLSFQFGDRLEEPFMVGNRIATLGSAGQRSGRMFIDQDGSHDWSAADTNKMFMRSMRGDKPFSIRIRKTKLSRSCEPVAGVGGIDYVVGIFRDGEWYIDQNGNGVWDGVGADRCDRLAKFGQPLDIPVPLGGRLAVVRRVPPGLHWVVDEDASFSFTAGDAVYTSFGNEADRPFSSSALGQHGVQRIRPQNGQPVFDVFLNNDSDRNWSAGDIEALGHVTNRHSHENWRVIGWYAVTFPH
jgi:hypothetical protein